MLNRKLKLNEAVFTQNGEKESTRKAFGEALVQLGKENKNVVVLSADLKESTCIDIFAQNFPNRFIEVGVAEQNMASMAAGLALEGKIPFISSHAVFSPYRNWDQIRASICFQKANVKIVGTHLGFSNGPDGGIAHPLEDIAITRVLPNLKVVSPVDADETKKAVFATAREKGPVYLRLCKAETPKITTKNTPFDIGCAYVLSEGKDLTIISNGPVGAEALKAAKELRAKYKIETEVINCPTIKPLDEKTIMESAEKTKRVVVVEEHQIAGGLGGAICELISEKHPLAVMRIGMKDSFSESGSYRDLLDKYGLSSHQILERILKWIS